MRKLLLLFSFMLIGFLANSQEWDEIFIVEQINLGDSGVTKIYEDTLVNPPFVRNLIATTPVIAAGNDTEIQFNNSGVLGASSNLTIDGNYVEINDSLKVTKSLTFGENEGESNVPGKTYYDTTDQSLTFFNDIPNFTHQLGYEHVVRFYNNTGSTLTNGTVVRSSGSKVNGSVTFTADLAGNGSLDSLQGIAMVTADVLTGEFGVATLIGQVNGLNTSTFSDNDLLWVGHMGEYVNTSPTPPSYSAIFARIVYADADSGAIYIFPIGNTDYRPSPAVSISFSRESETITNPGINTPELITNVGGNLYTADYSVGFTLTADSLSPTQDGIYAISSQCAFQGDAANADDWRVGVFLNGVEQFSVLRTSSSTNKGVVAVSKILSLNTGDWVTLKVENTTSGTRDSVFTDAVINIEYITSQ